MLKHFKALFYSDYREEVSGACSTYNASISKGAKLSEDYQMKCSEAMRAISEKLQAAYAGRINTPGVISAYGPVVYAQYDAGGIMPISVCIQEGERISDRYHVNLAEMPDRAYLLADLFKAIVRVKQARPLKCRVVNW